MRNREGELLGDRYRVEGPDGEGWTATDLTSGKRVHVAFVPRTAREGAQRVKSLKGAHVVKVLDAGETAEGATFIVREHCASDALTKHLAKRGAMSVKDAAECALAVCDAIAEAHAAGLTHGALDASNVYVAFSASGLVDIQVAGIATSCPPRPRDDVRAIVKLLDAMLGGRVPDDLKKATATALRVLDLADALVPFTHDKDFAADRVEACRTRSSTSASVFAEGGVVEVLPELAPAIRAVPPKPARSVPPSSLTVIVKEAAALSAADPTIIAKRPVLKAPRRRFLRAIGVVSAAVSVALLVVIGTEGSRVAHTAQAATQTQAMELPPPSLPAAVVPVVVTSSVVIENQPAVPVVRASDLPPAKTAKKHR